MMEHKRMVVLESAKRSMVCAVLLAGFGIGSAWAQEKHAFTVKAEYVEGCSCSVPCTCQLTGVEPMCQGVNAVKIIGGKYQGADLAGGSFAFATKPGKWVRIYINAANPKQRDALVALARAYTEPFGKVEDVKDAKVDILGRDGKYTLQVDDGKIMTLVTEPVLGGDNKTPLAYSNIHDTLHPTIKQGKTIRGSYHDGSTQFELKDSNAFFNDKFETKGEL